MTDPTARRPQALRQLVPMLVEGERSRIAYVAIAALVTGFTEAAVLVLIARIAFALTASDPTVEFDIGPLGPLEASIGLLVGLAAALVVARLLAQALGSWQSSQLQSRVLTRTRQRLTHTFLNASWSLQSQEREGQLQEFTTTYATWACNAVQTLTSGVVAFLSLSALLISALVVDPIASLIVLLLVVLLAIALRPLRRHVHTLSTRASRAGLEYATSVSSVAATAQEIRIFRVEPAVRGVVDARIEDHSSTVRKTRFLGTLIPGVYQTAALMTVVATLGIVYAAGVTGLASVSAVVLIMLRAISYGQVLQGAQQGFYEAAPYLETLRDEETRYTAAAIHPGGVGLSSIESLEFAGVSFEYEPNRPALKDLSFNIDRGEVVGIVGPSGSGKSTLVQLLLRLRHPTAGTVKVNGVPAREFLLDDWYKLVTFVPQEARVVPGTVAENIRFFRRASTHEIQEAATIAHLHDDILSWPLGYETPVGSRGSRVSGGERQRLCIARALLGRPEIVVLDEPTSALDPHSEARMRETFTNLAGQATLFIVAHRLSTLDICDRIMVLQEGEVRAFDAPARLAESSGFYADALRLSGLR